MNLAKLLQPPIDALKIGQRLLNGDIGDVEFGGHRDRRQRIQHIVPPRQIDGQIERRMPLAKRLEARLQSAPLHADRAHIGGRGESVGDERPRHGSLNALHVPVVGAQHRETVERQVVQKIHETLFEPRKIAVVSPQMIGVDVGDDRDHRLQMHEGGIALVRFGDQVAPRPEPRIAVGALETAADDEGGVEAAFREHARDQTRGGGFAVSARDRDGVPKAHQFAQHFRARHHRYAPRDRGRNLRIGAVDGARDHHHVRLPQMLGGMAHENFRAQSLEALRHGICLQIRALHLVAQVEQHLGNPSHAAAADADQMYAMDAAHAIVHARDAPRRHA